MSETAIRHTNFIIVEGFLGADPEMRYTPSGKKVTAFRIGNSRDYRTAEGEIVKHTNWFFIEAWGRLGENADQFLAKGRHVLVEGTLSNNQGSDGRTYWTIVANQIRFLDALNDRKRNEEEEYPF